MGVLRNSWVSPAFLERVARDILLHVYASKSDTNERCSRYARNEVKVKISLDVLSTSGNS